MQILDIRILRGPNYWSTYRTQLIDMLLDLEATEETPTNLIDGFAERLEELMPSLYDHRCSEARPGGFLERVKSGTWMGHVIEHIALELQSLAGMPCGFGRTRSASKRGVYHVVFAYQVENAGVYAAKAALKIAHALVNKEHIDINDDLAELSRINTNEGLGPSTLALVREAKRRRIPCRRLDNNSLVMLGHGVNQKIVCATMASTTSSIGVEVAGNKERTRRILGQGFIPVPDGSLVNNQEELSRAIKKLGFPLVVKPATGNHGRGVKVNIQSEEEGLSAFALAKKISDGIIVEKFIEGHDYRFLVINFKLEAVARRTPAMIIGDGESTIEQLIEATNNDPRRGTEHEKVLTRITVDEITQSILDEKNLSLHSILPFGDIVFLKGAANLSSGGTASDVTDMVHPANVFLVERIARLVNIDICGIDIVAKDISSPITKGNGAVIEVNAAPGFRMHLSPSRGLGRNVAEPVINMLFPEGKSSRIPIVAVTGTNGKTTTTRLIAHLAQHAGYTVGHTNTDGIYINGQEIYHGDCSGPSSAEAILRDPIVDFAVLECARGGILRSGLAFDKCDISVITNITSDHLGLKGIDTLEELARVKSVVVRSTCSDGYAILNADDDLVYEMKDDVDCNVALFSTQSNNERIQKHCDEGGLAILIEKGYFTLWRGEWRMRVAKVRDVPLTMNGQAACMIKNILPAILAASIQGFDTKIIREALESFVPGPEFTPGRMNLFQFRNCQVLLDYAHNEDGFAELGKYLQSVHCTEKVGIIASPGDRRDQDIEKLGYLSGMMFDKIIIRHDKEDRGRANDEITKLLLRGVRSAAPDSQVMVIPDEIQAIEWCMINAAKGAFIVVCTEEVQGSIQYLTHEKNKETSSLNTYQ